MQKFYQKGDDGKYANAGWPKYVDGLLSDEEQAAIIACHDRCFAWENRRPALLRVIASWEADLISLVECDYYDEFFLPEMQQRGFEGVYKKRPRPSSTDGCAIFYRTGTFKLLASDSMEFVDKVDPASGKTYKDRVGLLALLEHCSGRKLIFISTHLARNPEDPSQTKSRAKQAAQLLKCLTDFASKHGALDEPAMLAGDLNTTNIRQIADIARTVFELCNEAVHPFIFSASAPRTLPTSVTTTRRMCIDYFFIQSSLEVVDQDRMLALTMDDPVPNEQHPSDHLPILFTMAFRPNSTQLHATASQWVAAILASTGDAASAAAMQHAKPLARAEVARAFQFFDVAGDGVLQPTDLRTGLMDLGLLQHFDALNRRLELIHGRQVTLEAPLTLADFQQAYLAGFLELKQHFSESMRDAFDYFDQSGDGKLELDELYQSFVDACPFEMPKEAFTRVFRKLDANGDGHVTVDEFIDFLLKCQLE